MKNLEELKLALPEYAKDIRINIETLLSKENQLLNMKQIMGLSLAVSYVARNANLINIFENEAKNILSEIELKAVKTATTIMAMNNIYYRFGHITQDKEYLQMPAGLRMKGLADHGIEKNDFEIFALAVSIANGCSGCIDAHAMQLIKHGFNKSQVQMVAKISAVILAAGQVLLIENKL